MGSVRVMRRGRAKGLGVGGGLVGELVAPPLLIGG